MARQIPPQVKNEFIHVHHLYRAPYTLSKQFRAPKNPFDDTEEHKEVKFDTVIIVIVVVVVVVVIIIIIIIK
jgi:hypothetical protein